jgi:ATP-dependent Clp protease ATP-binding subunit ClpA
MTGIPVNKLARMSACASPAWSSTCTSGIIGQYVAVLAVSESRQDGARRPQGHRNAPSADSCSLGPTGVGKTELAKALAEFMFGGRRRHASA